MPIGVLMLLGSGTLRSRLGIGNINFLNVVKFIWCSSKNVIFGPFLPSSLCGGSVCSWVQYLLNFTHFRCETFLLYGLKSIFNWVCVSFYPLPDLCSSTIICFFFFIVCLFNLFPHGNGWQSDVTCVQPYI